MKSIPVQYALHRSQGQQQQQQQQLHWLVIFQRRILFFTTICCLLVLSNVQSIPHVVSHERTVVSTAATGYGGGCSSGRLMEVTNDSHINTSNSCIVTTTLHGTWFDQTDQTKNYYTVRRTLDSIVLRQRNRQRFLLLKEKPKLFVPSSSLVWNRINRGGGDGSNNNDLNNIYYNNNQRTSQQYQQPMTIGDLDQMERQHQTFSDTSNIGKNNNNVNDSSYHYFSIPKWSMNRNIRNRSTLQQIQQIIANYVTNLHTTSPIISVLSWSCILVFLLWQFVRFVPYPNNQRLLQFLQHYFVCNQSNVFHHKKMYFPSILLATLSHMNVFHLLFNLLSFISFGPTIQKMMEQKQRLYIHRKPGKVMWYLNHYLYSFPLLLIGGGVIGNIMFLLLDRTGMGSCLGLSGVTFTLLTLYGSLYPTKKFRILLGGIFPIQLDGEQFIQITFIYTLIGSIVNMMSSSSSSNIAHSAHLGGLIFGLLYHKMVWKR